MDRWISVLLNRLRAELLKSSSCRTIIPFFIFSSTRLFCSVFCVVRMRYWANYGRMSSSSSICVDQKPSRQMPRYFFNFAYLGSRFSGSQSQPNQLTVQGVLEVSLIKFAYFDCRQNVLAMILLSPLGEEPRWYFSSRTDAGVHAFMNTATVDLDPERDFDSDYLKSALNSMLTKLDMEIRINSCRRVSGGFCARRHALEREYLYRLAILKPEFESDHHKQTNNTSTTQNAHHSLPLIEHRRAWALSSAFNHERFRKAALMFQGSHNFASFMTNSVGNLDRPTGIATVKNISRLDIDFGKALMDSKHEPCSDFFNFFDVSFVSRSFLYNQVNFPTPPTRSVSPGFGESHLYPHRIVLFRSDTSNDGLHGRGGEASNRTRRH
ncbi:tRNA pseudouridine synthase A [Trichinella spiralis]|uniref:tRNA pseudouridine synthase A n=1 Tax=Trichinella spiralis TaxID=6334 RepID=UPI0001EFE4C2|nr:tRNA pseudouridine synthase A [Trichinella spiralis]